MRTLIGQIESSLGSGAYYLSLFAALAIPDIAGALSSDDGEATGKKYIEWYERWVRPRFAEVVRASIPEHARQFVKDMESPLTGDACYRFRCSLLHQGSSQHPKSPYARIIFIEPGTTTNVIHYGQLNDALCIDLNLFCREVISGARLWLDSAEKTELFQKNYEKFARRHVGGLAPYISGVPVVG
ncbi:hypothetical protein [Methylocaldum sp.]|uniref:hypothetical protein n=1 Tax=Methylocaldum sp. TaxID=1969727 RepID=UPI002D61C867|nr:hypothetical protein [Methylocaldum sp.]HYE34137.1 hypothetical protein [Methylocaldum sp.]